MTLALTIGEGSARLTTIREFVRAVVPKMFDDCTEDKHITLSVLSGGLTNQLYRVIKTSDKSVSVVARVFGKETERLISRDAELFWQSQFLKTYGKCQNGLVYEFLAGFKEMPPAEMEKYWYLSARATARYHVKASRAGLMVLPYATQGNFTTVALRDWLAVAQSAETMSAIVGPKAGKTPEQLASYKKMDFEALSRDCALVLKALEERASRLPQGSCHNDLLGANIMVNRDPSTGKPVSSIESFPASTEQAHLVASGVEFDKHVRVIDFEYGYRNYLYYDIANHFNEFGGFDCDWSKYPKDSLALQFIELYLQEMEAGTVEAGSSGTSSFTMDPQQVLQDVKLMSCASHLCWTSWSIIQGAYSVIDFDYFGYALQRYEGAQVMKAQCGL